MWSSGPDNVISDMRFSIPIPSDVSFAFHPLRRSRFLRTRAPRAAVRPRAGQTALQVAHAAPAPPRRRHLQAGHLWSVSALRQLQPTLFVRAFVHLRRLSPTGTRSVAPTAYSDGETYSHSLPQHSCFLGCRSLPPSARAVRAVSV